MPKVFVYLVFSRLAIPWFGGTCCAFCLCFFGFVAFVGLSLCFGFDPLFGQKPLGLVALVCAVSLIAESVFVFEPS